MKFSIDLVFDYLNLNLDNKFQQGSELLESVLLINSESNEFDQDYEYNLEYFLVFEDSLNVYFNRIRNLITKIINSPLKISRFNDACCNLIYSLLAYSNNLKELVNSLNDIDYQDESESFHFQEILSQLRETILIVGNWKHLSSLFVDSKCSMKDKSAIESVHSVGAHTLMSIQNILLYLVHFLTQRILAYKQFYMTLNFDICSFLNDDLSEDESSMFIQYSYLVINNLFHLHLNWFKKNFELKEFKSVISSLTPCECISKCWTIAYRLMQTYDTNGYLTKIQQIFWFGFNRISTKFKKSETITKELISNRIYLESEANYENIVHFIFMLNYDLFLNLRSLNDTTQLQPASYLDPCYNIFKTTLKDILDQNQGVGQIYFNRLRLPLQILCNLIDDQPMLSCSQTSISSSLGTSAASNISSQKICVDILILLWESYFCKNISSTFLTHNNTQSSNTNLITDSLSQPTDFKFMLHTIENKICCAKSQSDLTDTSQLVNLYHLFLKYLYLNIKESNQANPSVNNSWRAFKGRLYTRIHDKRIAELDLTGLVNLAYLFYVLIKCFSFLNLTSTQLKYDQVENYFRILNVFIKSKNLNKLESILMLASSTSSTNSISSKTNALKIIFNTKFTCLRLWFQTNEFLANVPNNDEIEQLIRQEFIAVLNEWLDESMNYYNPNKTDSKPTSSNQISGYKNSQTIAQFFCDIFAGFIENCHQFLYLASEDSFSQPWPTSIHSLTYITCQILNGIKFDILFKMVSRKQFELICCKLAELITTYKSLIKKELSSYAYNSKLSELLTDLTLKLWNTLLVHQNSATIFSYEIISNIFFELCSLYSNLFYNPESLLINSTKPMKLLLEMIDQMCFYHLNSAVLISSSVNFDDNTPLTIVRLKILNNLLNDDYLFEICKRNMANFQAKLINFMIFAYLYNANINKNDLNSDMMRDSADKTNIANTELKPFLKMISEKLQIFTDLKIKFDYNIEQFVIDFITKYSFKLKQIESFADKKVYLDNFNLYFQEFIKLINSLASISSHAVIYKMYLLAAHIVTTMSMFLHSRGKSDTLFAKIIDKMILPFGPSKTNSSSKSTTSSNVSLANNLNSILMSLKDTLHLFLIGISNLNYEYDGYLQRVLQTIISNFSMKFQMLQFEDHFLVTTIEPSFSPEPANEAIHFRNYLLKLIKQSFLTPNSTDLERCLSMIQYILSRTESNQVINKDAEIYFSSMLLFLANDTNALKTKALAIFNIFISKLNEANASDDIRNIYSKQIDSFIRQYWGQIEPGKMFVSLCMIAKLKPNLITPEIKKLILQKVEETHTKFRYNTELKNTLFTLFEYLDGEQGKVYLNNFLGQIF